MTPKKTSSVDLPTATTPEGNTTFKIAAQSDPFAGGDGTPENPYLVSTAEQLDAIRDYLSSSFLLINDISLEEYDWLPIGNDSNPFTGTLDGGHYTIYDFTSTRSAVSYYGMSRYGGLVSDAQDATFKNLNFDGVSLKIGGNGGIIVASATNCKILNCSVRNADLVFGSYSGGIVGYFYGNADGRIDNCSVDLTLKSSGTCVGGIAGWIHSGAVSNCITTGSLSGVGGGMVGYTGGIAGRANPKGFITNCISACSLQTTRADPGYAAVGGLVGWGADSIENSIALNRYISGEDGKNGGIVGELGSGNPSGLLTTYTWAGIDNSLSDNFNENSGTFVTSEQVWNNPAFYTSIGFDLQNIWQMGTGDTYQIPELRGHPAMRADVSYLNPAVDASFDSGSGTVEDPYKIVSAKQLDHIRGDHLSAHFILMRDLSLANYEWQPIGGGAEPFTGTFDGNGYTIRNVRVSGDAYTGLFGSITGATITDLIVSNIIVTGTGDYAGGLAGRAEYSTITNCGVRLAEITTSGSYAGMLVGSAEGSGAISSSSAGGTVSGKQYVGGIAGYSAVALENVVTGGSVTSTQGPAGGIAGEASAPITNALSTASVMGGSGVAGGIVGVGDSVFTSLAFNREVSGSKAKTGLVAVSGEVDDATYVWEGVVNPVAGEFGGIGGIPVDSETFWNNAAFYEPLGWSFAAGPGTSLWTLGTEETFLLPVLRSHPAMNVDAKFLGPVVGRFTHGSGTAADPYHVATDLQMNNVRNFPSSHFVLMNDISLANFTNWNPIAGSPRFTGSFDGNDHVISDLSISGKPYASLFGYVSGGVIRNLHLQDVSVDATSATGAIAAIADSTTIANCSVRDAAIVTSGTHAGLLVGQTQKTSAISNCSVSGTVTAASSAGGIVGQFSGTITNSTAVGTVTATSGLAGGIAGTALGSVTHCISACQVATPSATSVMGSKAGGLVGSLGSVASPGSISNSVAFGKSVDGQYTDTTGRIAGTTEYGTVTASYAWDSMKNPSGGNAFGGANGLDATRVQLWNTTTLYKNTLGFDISSDGDTLWVLDTGTYYQLPVLAGHPAMNGYAKHLAPNEFAGGEGSEDNPYVIYTAEQLDKIRGDELSSHFILAADISLEGYDWVPLGSSATKFTGAFNGRGYTISNLTTTGPAYPSLFGYVSDATLENLHLENVSINSPNAYNAGALAGSADSSTITGCSVRNVTVTAKGWSGMLVGIVAGNTAIAKCSAVGSVTCEMDRAGGILGSPLTGGVATIEDCIAAGSVSAGRGQVGGIAGYLTDGSALRHVVSTCTVSAQNAATSNAGSVYGFGEKITVRQSVGLSRYVDGVASNTTGAFAGKTGVVAFTDNRNWDGTINRLGELGGKKANGVVGASALWDSAPFYRDVLAFDLTNTWTMGTEDRFLLPVLRGHPAMGFDAGYIADLDPVNPEIPPPEIVENTVADGTWGAKVPAKVVYEFVPAAVSNVSAPVIEYGSRSLVLTEEVTVEQRSGDVWSSVAASVSADGRLEIIGDVSGAELLRATFAGRTLGDVTGDGTVNAYDPLRISRSLAGLITLDEDQVFYADVTGEGTLNAYDSLRISRHLAGIVDEHYGVTP